MKKIHALLRRWISQSQNTVGMLRQSGQFNQNIAQNVVFFNNRFENCFNQVLPFFESKFFTPSSTQIVFKYYPANFEHITEICDQRGIEWACFSANHLVPALANKNIFYPFNSAANAAIVANRSNKHILLMHGESNKVACIKPLARLYDYVLVAGDIACDRLLEHQIFSKDDIERGRVIKLGKTVIGHFENFKHAEHSDKATLGYFPTWEGGNECENLSSLEIAGDILLQTARTMHLETVILRLHPNTGDRLALYADFAHELISHLHDNGLEVVYASMGRPTVLEAKLRERFLALKWHSSKDDAPFPIAIAITDVSAFEAIIDAKSIPALTIIKHGKFIAAPQKYMNFKKNAHIYDSKDVPKLLENLPKLNVFASDYHKLLISYSDPKLSTMTDNERMAWLTKYLSTNAFWCQ